MKKLTFILILFSIFAVTGCIFFEMEDENDDPITKNFWAQNAVTKTFYSLTADKLAENSICEVWVEKGSGVTKATANNIANEYINNIYGKMINNFGWEDNIPLNNGGYKRMNTMQYAHALATGSISGAKLTILLLDIKDDYRPGVNESYVGGYFWPYDLFSPASVPQEYKSNSLDMIYIDTNPGFSKDIKEVYTTLAHEMQHLMNFTSSAQYRVNDKTVYSMDIWIDEGLSSAAEQIYSGEYLTHRIEWFIQNGAKDSKGNTLPGKIDVGNNFYVWGNRVTDSEPYPALDDYATVYLFFQWIRLQSGNDIYKEIIKSPYPIYDQRAVINAFNAKKPSGSVSYSNWESMLKDWLMANNMNLSSGRNGYMNDPTLKTIKAPYAPAGTTTLGLFPGEGVYSYADTAPSVSNTGNIKYVYPVSTKTLLTYNSNPVNYVGKGISIDTLAENGTTTGITLPAASIVISGKFDIKLGSSKISGPFRIGMGDVIRMNNPGTFNFDGLKTEKVFIDE